MSLDSTQKKAACDVADIDAFPLLDRSVARIARRPRWLAYGAGGVLVALGWIWLTVMASISAAYEPAGSTGPGMEWLGQWLPGISERIADSELTALFLAICAPAVAGVGGPGTFVLLVAMWFLMSVAMMLPTATPMLRTYSDIADVAAKKGEQAVGLSVLAAGYLTVWLAFSVLAAAFQLLLIRTGAAFGPAVPVSGVLGSAILAGAGLYQFSSLKNACLEKCRNPFTILFANWSDKTAGIFRLGGQQGLYCLGCCWALMMVMLVVGTMNVIWMVFFTLFALLEKSVSGKVTSRVTGSILIAWAAMMAMLSMAAT